MGSNVNVQGGSRKDEAVAGSGEQAVGSGGRRQAAAAAAAHRALQQEAATLLRQGCHPVVHLR